MAEIFTRKFSEVSGGRFDAEYYRDEFVKLEQTIQAKTSLKLSDFIINISSGATPDKKEAWKYYTEDKKSGIPFLRVQNIKPDTTISSDFIYITKETHENMLKRSQVFENDLIITITGRLGTAAVAPKGFIGNINQHSVVIKTKNLQTSQALATFLNTSIGEKLSIRRATGGTRPALDYKALKSIPIIYNETIYHIIEKANQLALQKENKAKELLDSIDSYLLEELGIILPLRANNTLDSRIYTQKISALSGSRFDANYHQPYYKKFEQALESGKYKTLRLVDICQFRRGSFPQPYGNQEWYGGANAMPFVQVADIDDNFELKEKTNQQISQLAQPKSVFVSQNTIILSIQGTIGRVAITQYDCYVDRTIAIFTELSNLLNQHFLAYMLSILFKNKADTARGITLKTITKEEFRNFKIPLPPLTEQERIAKEISQRKAQAKALKQEAKESLESAKKEVEHIILGG